VNLDPCLHSATACDTGFTDVRDRPHCFGKQLYDSELEGIGWARASAGTPDVTASVEASHIEDDAGIGSGAADKHLPVGGWFKGGR
jgi:hypothetical protein